MSGEAFVPMRRRIFSLLRAGAGPMTVHEIAEALGAHVPTIANTCSLMQTMGALDRPLGARQGYRLIVFMLPEDVAAVADFVNAYGRDHMLDAVELAAAEQHDAAPNTVTPAPNRVAAARSALDELTGPERVQVIRHYSGSASKALRKREATP
jgi:DNA-binding transcriptional ArsR family regulator